MSNLAAASANPLPVSTVDLFGRRWEIKVMTQSGTEIIYTSSAWDPEALRATFDINQNMLSAMWTAEISIYNLNYQTATQAIPGAPGVAGTAQISLGDQITVSAGYQHGSNYGVIWVGQIYQVTYERENVTDYKTTFMCLASIEGWNRNLVSTAYPAQMSQYNLVKMMIANSQTPKVAFNMVPADQQAISGTGSPRAGVMHGDLAKYMGMTADQQDNWITTHTGQGLLLGDIASEDSTPDYTYAPAPPPGQTVSYSTPTTQSLIGSPVQYQAGVQFQVLLDARLKCQLPLQLVKLDMTVIKQLQQSISTIGNEVPQLSLVVPLDKTGQFFVVALRHVGDTRENTWLTYVTAAQNLEHAYDS
jgi:hypothetical protein